MKAFAAAFLLLTVSAHAQQLSFKGVPLGADRQVLMDRFASLACVRPPPQFKTLGDEHCTQSACLTPACAASDRLLSTYAELPAWDVSLSLVDGRFSSFAATIHQSSYEGVRDALRSTYGPGVESERAVQTAGGATLKSREWEAKLDGGVLHLFERAGRIDQGRVTGMSDAHVQRARGGAGTKKKSSDI